MQRILRNAKHKQPSSHLAQRNAIYENSMSYISLNSLHIEPVSEKSLKEIYLKGELLFTNTNTRSRYINHTREA